MSIAIDCDSMRRDDPAYWACALAMAMRDGDRTREATTRESLRRLGYDVVRFPRRRSRGASHAK